MSKTIEIGPYSAYAIAVKYGYVGTEEDWIKAVEAARKSAETSAASAKKKADEAYASAATATEQARTATTKAGESAASADASASSASAAAISEANAKKYSEEAGAKANTDKTLSIENAPADAKATGDALAGKADKSIVQDESGNAIFYSKAEVEAKIKEILAAQREEDLARIKFWASDDPTSPASFIGGTWERVEGEFIMGASSAYPVGTTGGSATHTQTTAEMPSHSHSGSTGSAGSHSHSASTDSAGWYSHSGTTDWAGSHTHDATINSNGSSTGGNSGLASSSMAYGDSYYKATITTKSAGSHTHSFSTNGTGSHSHSVSIGDAGAHTHTVSIGSTGSGQAMSVLNPYYALYIWVRVDDAA